MLALWLKQWREYQALLSSLVAVTSLAWLGLPDTSWLSASDKLEDKMEDVSQGTREVSETTEGVSDEGAVEAEETPTSQPVYGSFPITLTLNEFVYRKHQLVEFLCKTEAPGFAN